MRINIHDVIRRGPDGLTDAERYIKFEKDLKARHASTTENGDARDENPGARVIKYSRGGRASGLGKDAKQDVRVIKGSGGVRTIQYAGGAR